MPWGSWELPTIELKQSEEILLGEISAFVVRQLREDSGKQVSLFCQDLGDSLLNGVQCQKASNGDRPHGNNEMNSIDRLIFNGRVQQYVEKE